MKLRILGNSIRLRLTQPEVETFAGEGVIEERIRFGAETVLTYALEAAAVARPVARYDGRRVTVQVPSSQGKTWAETDQVGMEGTQPLDGGEVLTILVEKDFKCLHGPADRRDADAFPNPLAEEMDGS